MHHKHGTVAITSEIVPWDLLFYSELLSKCFNYLVTAVVWVKTQWAWKLVPKVLARAWPSPGMAWRYLWQPCLQEPPMQQPGSWCITMKGSQWKTILTQWVPKVYLPAPSTTRTSTQSSHGLGWAGLGHPAGHIHLWEELHWLEVNFAKSFLN